MSSALLHVKIAPQCRPKIGEQTRLTWRWFHAFLWNFSGPQGESRVKESKKHHEVMFYRIPRSQRAGAGSTAGLECEGGFRGLFQSKVVTNEPYSGVGITTSRRTLSDGNTIDESSCVKEYRDSSGRTRRERNPIPSTCSATPQSILIHDPVAGVEYRINLRNSTYRQLTIKAPPAETTAPARNHPANPNQVQTSLGTEAIAGTSFSAQGTQTVTTIPAGKFGNKAGDHDHVDSMVFARLADRRSRVRAPIPAAAPALIN